MKPLSIDTTGARVRLDGPALRIEAPQRAAQWFPLSRLSRVVTGHRSEWSTDALLACAEQRITVCFVAADGRLLARCITKPVSERLLQQRWADFLLSDDWPERYACWYRSMEKMAARSLARRMGFDDYRSVDPRRLRRHIDDRMERAGLAAADQAAGKRLCALLETLVLGLFDHARLDIEKDCVRAEQLDLAADCVRLFFLDCRWALFHWLRQRHASQSTSPPIAAELARFFEQRSARTERLAQGLINRLHRWLVEID
jgi:CRISPR associated protein Cas1